MSINDEDDLKQFSTPKGSGQSNVGDAYTEGKRLLMEQGVEFLDTEEGKAWFKENGKDWLKSDAGKDWLKKSKDGKDWLKSVDGNLPDIEHNG